MNNAITDAIERITGGKPGGYYIAGLFFSFIGVLISLYHSSRKRDPLSKNTPLPFSFTFLLWDNAKKLFISLLVMFILFRVFDLSNVLVMIGAGVAISIMLDKLVEWLMQQSEWICNLLSRDRSKFPQKPTDNENNIKPSDN